MTSGRKRPGRGSGRYSKLRIEGSRVERLPPDSSGRERVLELLEMG